MLRRAIKVIAFATGTVAALKIKSQYEHKPHIAPQSHPKQANKHVGTQDIFRKLLKQPERETDVAFTTKKLFSPAVSNMMKIEEQEGIFESYKIFLFYPAGVRMIKAAQGIGCENSLRLLTEPRP